MEVQLSAGGSNGTCCFFSPDPDRELQDTTARDPLPDLLPQRERSPQASPQHRAPGVADPRLDDEVVELVANQLKRIGDDLNATILQRMVRMNAHTNDLFMRWCIVW